MKIGFFGVAVAAGSLCAAAASPVIVETDAYRWAGDTIFQDEFKAWAVNPYEIQSTYKGRPGYFMPIKQSWKRKNDLSPYPQFLTDNLLHTAIYNMGLDEMVNAVEPDSTLRTGKEWAGVWTRDVSYSIILSMAYMQPEASMISLMKKVNPSGQIIQDTGSGGAWPISTDRMVWVLAAWELYKVSGDRSWLEKVYPIAARSIEKDEKTVMSARGLVKGETSFIDWREQSYPRWMQTADIAQSEAMGTNVMYAAALQACADMASTLGKKREADKWHAKATALAANIDKTFWMPDKGYYGMYTYGSGNNILNPRAETLGEALAILYDIAPAEHQISISENNPHTPFGPAIFYPQIADVPNYHNNALWPFVASYWTLAQAKAGNEQGVLEGIGSVYRPAALFATNKENFNLDNGDIYTQLNSSNMLWSIAGNIALTTRVLFGIHFEKDGLVFRPFVPEPLAATRTLRDFPYRGAKLNITVEGYGDKVKELTVNGKSLSPAQGKLIPANMLKDGADVYIKLNSEPIAPMKLNRTVNKKAPLTPITWLANNPALDGEGVPVNNQLQWNPIEYIGKYIVLKDGKPVAETRATTYAASEPGEWQVIGVAVDGTQSFASEPRSNRESIVVPFAAEGYVAIDKETAPVEIEVMVPEAAVYTITVDYTNGNGPVNTKNKAAVRTLTLDGYKAGTIVMPQRGRNNWEDIGKSSSLTLSLESGLHRFGICYLPEDENMNRTTNGARLYRLRLEKH